MNNKTITEFGFRIIWRIMEISEGVINTFTFFDLHIHGNTLGWWHYIFEFQQYEKSASPRIGQWKIPRVGFFNVFFYILKSFPFTSNLEGSVAKRLDLWTSNRPASIHAFPGRAEDWLGLFAYSWSCHINICFIYSSFMPHVSLDSIIESFIAVGGVSLWVSSVCWDTK